MTEKLKPGTYDVQINVTMTVMVRDLTQEEIDEHGEKVIKWAIMEDFELDDVDYSTMKILDVSLDH